MEADRYPQRDLAPTTTTYCQLLRSQAENCLLETGVIMGLVDTESA